MRTALLLALAFGLIALAPVATAQDPPPGFGRCEVVWYSYGEYDDPLTGERRSIDAPGGLQCVW